MEKLNRLEVLHTCMSEICPVCNNGKLMLHNGYLVCHNNNCSNMIPVQHHFHPQEKCANCGSGRAILDNGEFFCDNCGIVFPLEEQITIPESDMPKKYTKIP